MPSRGTRRPEMTSFAGTNFSRSGLSTIFKVGEAAARLSPVVSKLEASKGLGGRQEAYPIVARKSASVLPSVAVPRRFRRVSV